MILRVGTDGRVKPLAIEWENGRRYDITKIIDKRTAPPRHVGSMPTIRFTVSVQGQTRELYYESDYNKWFVEKLLPWSP